MILRGHGNGASKILIRASASFVRRGKLYVRTKLWHWGGGVATGTGWLCVELFVFFPFVYLVGSATGECM